jgi:hypothetical protein
MLYSRPEDTSTAVWDDETGETWDEALARFATFGDLVDVSDAVRLVRHGHRVWSFGYGDDPALFTVITADDTDGLAERDIDFMWGPFAVERTVLR